MNMVLLEELQGGGAFVEDLGGEASGLKLFGEQGGKASLIFNDDHEWFLLGAHAERVGGKTRGCLQL
ncbi:hypothetical protein LBMAG55_03960 [Verrucomicrobiota bacterium]|nr:hypothetical protein LBMAG55_03960 [Verrucomicrobiota bacterium]